MAFFVRQLFNNERDISYAEPYINDLNDIYNPTMYLYHTYDMAANDAVFRQLKLDLEW